MTPAGVDAPGADGGELALGWRGLAILIIAPADDGAVGGDPAGVGHPQAPALTEANSPWGGVASPYSSSPQQTTEPSVVTPQVWPLPALTEAKPEEPSSVFRSTSRLVSSSSPVSVAVLPGVSPPVSLSEARATSVGLVPSAERSAPSVASVPEESPPQAAKVTTISRTTRSAGVNRSNNGACLASVLLTSPLLGEGGHATPHTRTRSPWRNAGSDLGRILCLTNLGCQTGAAPATVQT